MARGIIRILAPVLVICAGIAGFALLHAAKPEPPKSDHKPRPISVYTAPVIQSEVELEVITQGEVRARTELDLVAQVGGLIVSVSGEFTEGGRVLPGVPLLQIEDTDYRLALREASAGVAQAEVSLQQAMADAGVARQQLRNEAKVSDLALKKPQVAEARARLEANKANLEQAKLNLKRTKIALPFTGRLISTQVDTGQYVSPGVVMGRAFATDVVEVRLPLSDSQLASLGLPIGYTAEPGQGPNVTFTAQVAGHEHQWHGKLTRLDAAIDPDTRMLYGIAEVVDPYGTNTSQNDMPMAVGLFVAAHVAGRELAAAYVIPPAALRAGERVYLVSDNNTLDIRQVEVLQRSPERVVVTSGLQRDERVIISAIRNPVNGMSLLTIDAETSTVAAN